jgi:hypothetical protein
MKLNRDAVVALLIESFPSIEDELKDETWAGLLHLEMACFARLTQGWIDNGEKAKLDKSFALARGFFINGDEDVKNAVYVSFLENLNFRDGKKARAWARERLPVELKVALAELEAHMRRLAKRNDA